MRSTLCAILVLVGLSLIAASNGRRESASDAHLVVKGMTVSCSGSGRIWGTDAMVDCMAELKDLGVNWIAIHPYAGIDADGTVGGSRLDRMYGDDVSWLTRPIEEAHRLGMKIMIKPHIAYWGSKFSWRGVIKFDTEEQWDRFFRTYEVWITRVAQLSKDADAFAVGTELDATVHHESEWRTIIDAVRRKTEAPLTYSANWDSYQRVNFWDALDVIGVQSYFPLVDHENLPTTQELDEGWQRVLTSLKSYAKRYDKKIILAELGYNNSSRAARQPWDYKTGGPNAEEIQRRCMNAALKALENDDTIVGAFLWKWFPRSRRGGSNFIMSSPSMRQVIAKHWRVDEKPAFGE
ncbi:MAG: hypothetical protein O7G85_01345 [Planctomycetota bacterium]|nr:hypothetical protein [Planctomycetota bacterium]